MTSTSTEEIPSTPLPAMAVPRDGTFQVFLTTITIGFWYLISNAIILTTKWLFNEHFPYPLTVTAYSNFVAAAWAWLVSCTIFERQPLTRKQFFSYVLPIGFTTALEIGSSNVALKILTVSFGTILKGGGPIFTFVWGLLLGLEQFSVQVGVSLVLIAVGIALASAGEGTEFQLAGFCLQLFASALGGLRWAMTHKLLKQGGEGAPEPMSPLTATLYTSPMTSVFVLPFALALEASKILSGDGSTAAQPMELESTLNSTQQLLLDAATNSTSQLIIQATTNSTSPLDTSSSGVGESMIIFITMTSIASLVFVLLMSEYWLVKVTSSLALSVAGVFKELLTIGGGMLFFSDHIDALNIIGFLICQCGIMSYVGLRTDTKGEASEYAPVTVEEATREAMESRQEMLDEFGSERFTDKEDDQETAQFSIDDDDEIL